MLSGAVANEMFFTCIRPQAIVFLRPSNDAIFIYVSLRIVIGFQRLYKPLGSKLV